MCGAFVSGSTCARVRVWLSEDDHRRVGFSPTVGSEDGTQVMRLAQMDISC